jgi:HK97 family phage prohead protease
MPYYITKDAEDCAGWAVVKEDLEQLGCHLTKSAAIEQMIAISNEEGIEPGGELEIEDDDMEMSAAPVKLTAQVTIDAAGPNGEARRTISGIAVPYGQDATVSDGQRIRIEAGALPVDGKPPKLFMYHDASQPVGLVTGRVDTDEGMLFQAKIAKTALGDEALQLAQEGVLDSVSVGINPTKFAWDGDVMVIKKATWHELSLVPIPAFAGAAITDIAASASIHHETEQTSNTDPQEPQKETLEMSEQVEAPKVIEASAVPVYASVERVPAKLPTVAEYMAAYIRGGDALEAANREVNLWAKHHTPIKAAAGDQTTTDFPGVVPVPILGPVYDNIAPLRPLVTAVGARSMPGTGKTFIRPVIVTHTEVDNQGGDLVGLASRTMDVNDLVVTKQTFGGTVLVSEQTVDFTDPAALDIIIRDLMNQYAITTGNAACTDFANNIGGAQQVGTWDGSSEDFIAKVYAGTVAVLAAGRVMPTHLIMGTPGFGAVGALVDDAKRPLFPTLNPQNASGQMSAASTQSTPVGLSLVVDPGLDFAGDFIALGTAAGPYAGFEVYESMKGLVSVEKPDVLGRQISVRGYFASTYIDNTKFAWFDF